MGEVKEVCHELTGIVIADGYEDGEEGIFQISISNRRSQIQEGRLFDDDIVGGVPQVVW